MAFRTSWIVFAFLLASPPRLIASTTSPLEASAIAAKLFLPNFSSRLRLAADEFWFDVFWDRIVPTSESITFGTFPHVCAELLDSCGERRVGGLMRWCLD